MKKPLTLSDLSPSRGSKGKRWRVGRGVGSGNGKTSGRGQKGFGSRSGSSVRPAFEGGQVPLVRRIPKFGFTPLFRVEYQPVNVGLLNRFENGASVDPTALLGIGVIDGRRPVKILAKGTLERKLSVKAHAFSDAAKAAIEKAGGSVEILD